MTEYREKGEMFILVQKWDSNILDEEKVEFCGFCGVNCVCTWDVSTGERIHILCFVLHVCTFTVVGTWAVHWENTCTYIHTVHTSVVGSWLNESQLVNSLFMFEGKSLYIPNVSGADFQKESSSLAWYE